jgi:hypothetical protein
MISRAHGDGTKVRRRIDETPLTADEMSVRREYRDRHIAAVNIATVTKE